MPTDGTTTWRFAAAPAQPRRTTGRAYMAPPRAGQEATFYAPARGAAVTYQRGGGRAGGVVMQWNGQKVIEHINQVLFDGLARLRDQAQEYWETQEWTEARHPEMTGNERNSAVFTVSPSGSGTASFTFAVTTPYAEYEEFGTVHRPGHYPVRNTMDRVAYRARYWINKGNSAGPAPANQPPVMRPPSPGQPSKLTARPKAKRMRTRPTTRAEVPVEQSVVRSQVVVAPRQPAINPTVHAPRMREGMEVEVPGLRAGTWERGHITAIFGARSLQVQIGNRIPEMWESHEVRQPR